MVITLSPEYLSLMGWIASQEKCYIVIIFEQLRHIAVNKDLFIFTNRFIKTEPNSGKSVLVIGGGPSGIDLVSLLSNTASRITFSQHKRPDESKQSFEGRQKLLPKNVTLQENVKRFTSNGAEFIDGSKHTFEVVFFATGEDLYCKNKYDTYVNRLQIFVSIFEY